MNWDKLNNRLRQDAEEQHDEVDLNSIWNAIEPQVDEINRSKKKKRNVFFLWWGTGALLFSVGLWLVVNQFTTSTAPTSANNGHLKHAKNNIFTEKKETTLDTKLSTNQQNQTTPKPSNNINTSQNPKQNLVKSDLSTNNLSTKANNLVPPVTNQDIDKNPSTINNLPTIVTTLTNDGEVEFRGAQATPDRVDEKIIGIPSSLYFIDIPTEQLPLKNVDTLWFPSLKPNKNNEGKEKFAISIYGGANYTHRNLSLKEEVNLESTLLLTTRNQFETPLETSQLGIDFSFRILPKNEKSNFNIEITTGLQITNIAERYKNYSTTTESAGDIFGVKYLSYGLGDDPIEIMGWINQTKTTEYQKEIFNSFRMIDIPLLISYHQPLNEKWQVGIQGGIFTNLKLKTEGIIPTATLEDLDLNNSNHNYFKKNIGLSYHLGLTVRRKLPKNWELNFAPSIRYFGNDFTTDSYQLAQKYLLFGGNIGVRYRF